LFWASFEDAFSSKFQSVAGIFERLTPARAASIITDCSQYDKGVHIPQEEQIFDILAKFKSTEFGDDTDRMAVTSHPLAIDQNKDSASLWWRFREASCKF
jgi:hypothetical protein